MDQNPLKKRARSLIEVALLLLFGLLFIEPMWLLRGDYGSDDAGHFSHAATIALDFDLDYSNEPVVAWAAERQIAAGSPGAGWLAAPVVAALSILDRIQGHPIIEDHTRYTYSWSLFGFWVAALIYFMAGVWLYRRGIETLWPTLDRRLSMVLAFSTGVPFYVLRRFSMAHAFEFAICALGFWAAVKLYYALALGRPTRRWILWSAVAALANLAVRANNLNTLVLGHTIVLLLFVFGVPTLSRPPWQRVRTVLIRLTGAIALALVPLAAFNVAVYGAIYPTPALMYGQPLTGTASRTALEILGHGLTLLPNLVPLIFSSEFGVLWTNPVLVLGGVFLLAATLRRLVRRRDAPHALALTLIVVFFGLSTAIVLWWQTTATSYGYRYLFPLYPVALLGLLVAALGGRARESGRSRSAGDEPGTSPRADQGRADRWMDRLRRGVLPATLVLTAVSLASQVFISATETLETRPQVNVFNVHHSASAKGYLTRLPGEVVKPGSWVSLAARRLAGFYVAPYVAGGALGDRMPDDWIESYERLYRDAPPSAYLQLTFLLGLWVAGAWQLTRRAPRAQPVVVPRPMREEEESSLAAARSA